MTIHEAYELASGYFGAGRLQQAEFLVQQVLSRQPSHADALHLMGLIWHRYGRSAQSIGFIRQAIGLNASSADYHNSLATVLMVQGAADAAIAAARRAIGLRPDFPEASHNLATALAAKGQLDDSITVSRQALSLKPGYPEAEFLLANLLKQVGQIDEAIACYSRAATQTSDPQIASALLYALQLNPGDDATRLADEHARWNRTFAKPRAQRIRPHNNDRSPDRPLKIGYVSANFRDHPVGRFLAPLVANHDRNRFEVYCYCDVQRPDEITRRFDSLDVMWRNVVGLSDEELAAWVRGDTIDILVDLTLHMEGSRLLAFALEPAPVQVTYLGYPGASGLETMDYWLTDRYLEGQTFPPGGSQECLPHQLNSYWCYEAPVPAPPVGPSPVGHTGHLTFGCLNDYSKITQPTWAAWRAILAQSEGSNLIVHAPQGNHRELARSQFAADQIDPRRVQFVDRLPFDRYLDQYNQIDIALDPFPCGGEITTCDALWMGVPVITLAGQTPVSRAGLSILSQLGLSELIARDIDQYVRTASALAADTNRVAELRSSLRPRMQSSSLMDAPAHARDVGAAYRRMWNAYLAGSVP